MNDLILYDASCSFCQKCILFILKRDAQKKFIFSHLDGEAAKSMSEFLRLADKDSLILVENYETEKQSVFYKSKAVFIISWKLGGFWKLVGWKKVLPSIFFDWAYDLVSKNRKLLCKKNALDPKSIDPKRFIL